MVNLLELLPVLLTGWFDEWRGLGSLLKLDSACCSAACRKAYLHVLRGSGFSLSTQLELDDSRMNWCIAKVVNVRDVGICDFDIDTELAAAFLKSVVPA
jgi:hypothetical protein